MIIRAFLALFLLALPHAAQASDPVWFNCNAETLRVGSVGDMDGKSYMIINGTIEVPSSGYKYKFYPAGYKDGALALTLTLIEPSGGALTVISALNINERFEQKYPVNRVDISFNKVFNWGPQHIKCTLR